MLSGSTVLDHANSLEQLPSWQFSKKIVALMDVDIIRQVNQVRIAPENLHGVVPVGIPLASRGSTVGNLVVGWNGRVLFLVWRSSHFLFGRII